MSCSASAGTSHALTVRSTPRCFTLFVPPREEGGDTLPLLIMHHGRTGGAGQFCTEAFASVARARGFALLCTQAVHGDWQFDALPSDVDRNACDSADQAYMRSIYAYLDAEPQQQLDPTRRFQAGFSQGALFAAVSSFCAADTTVGFGQSGSSFAPMKMRVVPSEPPLRVCVWCNRGDSSCHPMTAALHDAGHEAEMSWHAGGGHDYPHPWLPKIVACLHLLGALPPACARSGSQCAPPPPPPPPPRPQPRGYSPPHRRARLAAAPTPAARDATAASPPSSASRGAAPTGAAIGLLLDRRSRQPSRRCLGAAGLPLLRRVRRRLLVLGAPRSAGRVRASPRRHGQLRRQV